MDWLAGFLPSTVVNQLNQLLRPASQFEIKFPFAIELFFASGTVPVDPAPFAAGEVAGPSSAGPSSVTVVGLALKVLRTSLKMLRCCQKSNVSSWYKVGPKTTYK